MLGGLAPFVLGAGRGGHQVFLRKNSPGQYHGKCAKSQGAAYELLFHFEITSIFIFHVCIFMFCGILPFLFFGRKADFFTCLSDGITIEPRPSFVNRSFSFYLKQIANYCFHFGNPARRKTTGAALLAVKKKCVAKTGQKAEMPRKTGPCMRTNACRARLNACLIEMKHAPSRQNGARRPWFYTVPPYRQRSCMPFRGRGRRSPLRLLCRFGALPAQKKPGTRPGLFLSPRQETGEALPKR